MTAQALSAERFVRRTQLGRDEYRKNFRQLDRGVIDAVTSPEADAVTPLMSKIYLRLANAPEAHWEREGVLRFAGEERGGEWVTAWGQLVSLLGVASATARKALQWMHAEGVVGYYAGKNGVGIRVFLNRASSSIGRRPSEDKKILRLVRASNDGARASAGDTPFSDSFADLEVLETDLNPRAPKSGAETTTAVKPAVKSDPSSTELGHFSPHHNPHMVTPEQVAFMLAAPIRESVLRSMRELGPSLESMAKQAAVKEHERTREWLESRGLPKAARVAQRETYNVLRRYGVIKETAGSHQACGGPYDASVHANTPLSEVEAGELAQACVAMLEAQGQAVEVTLFEMSVAAGGFLLGEDVPRVREKVENLLAIQPERETQYS